MDFRSSVRYFRILNFCLTILIFASSVKTLSPEEIVRLEMEEFEREVDAFRKSEDLHIENHRNRRTVTFNVGAPLDLGVLIGIPLSIALPTMQNFFKWNWKWKRSLEDGVEESDNYFEDSAIAQPHLDRISSYFELIEIPERGCQQRAICEFSAEPEKFYPISELILNRIRHPSTTYLDFESEGDMAAKGQNHPGFSSLKPKSLLRLYNDAHWMGLANGTQSCAAQFSRKCPYATADRLNIPVLGFWHLLSSLLKFNFKDNLVMNMNS